MMPLKKYNTASALLASTSSSSSTFLTQQTHEYNIDPSTKTSPTCNNTNIKQSHQSPPPPTNKNLANQISSLSELLPNIIEATAASGLNASSGSASATITPSSNKNGIAATSLDNSFNNYNSTAPLLGRLPNDVRQRLHSIFAQIEREFDLIYAENQRLHEQLNLMQDDEEKDNKTNVTNLVKNDVTTNSKKKSKKSEKTSSNSTSSSSNGSSPKSKNLKQQPLLTTSVSSSIVTAHPSTTNIPGASSLASTLTNTAASAIASTSSSAKSAILSSKTRINNLSFPKFKPNAREFIMQSIKNTSAQLVNKTNLSHHNFNSKLQCNLTGHKDGIWDISLIQIPNNLLSQNNGGGLASTSSSNLSNYYNHYNYQNNASNNLLVGTASADNTARLWYLNSHMSNQQSMHMSPLQQHLQSNYSTQTNGQHMTTTAFCIQEYSGHTGSVNSIRFHPKFFTEATNLILTASGDCQAHIWQCVLSPLSDSLESTSQVVLNYSNCYAFAMKSNNNTSLSNNNNTGAHSVSSPPTPLYNHPTSPNYMAENSSYYHELISNTAIIRSPIKRYEGHSDACIAAEWFPDGEFLVTASWDRTANVYNVETGKILCNLQHDDYLTNVNIHKSQKIILTSSKDTTFKVWDFRDPICSVNVYQAHNRSVNSAIFVGDDKIATSSDDQTVKLWDLRIMRSPVCTINLNSGANRICSITTTNPDSSTETFLGIPLDNRDIKIYNLNGERMMRLPRNNHVGHRRLVTSLASHGNLLLSASFDKTVNCWSLDYNPPKSSSHKLQLAVKESNNKENSVNNNLGEQTSGQLVEHKNGVDISRNNLLLHGIVSSPHPSSNHQSSVSILNNNNTSVISQQLNTPLSLITNNSVSNKTSNTLAKLTERIKI